MERDNGPFQEDPVSGKETLKAITRIFIVCHIVVLILVILACNQSQLCQTYFKDGFNIIHIFIETILGHYDG